MYSSNFPAFAHDWEPTLFINAKRGRAVCEVLGGGTMSAGLSITGYVTGAGGVWWATQK